jgi:hypothetical protein
VNRWCSARNRPVGAVVSLQTAWALAVAWYTGRLEPDWRRRSPAEAQALFTSLGLVGQFWRVT